MKKKNLIIKDHFQREKTPDLNSIKTKKNRKAVAPITPSGSTTNIRKKNNFTNATKNPINIYASTADIHNTEQTKKFNKAKLQKKIDLNKTVIEPKKEIKKEYKAINTSTIKTETRSKSAAKRPIKHKNKDKDKDKDKNKKEELKKEDIKKDNNDNSKKEEIKKVDNKNEDIKKEENQVQKINISNTEVNTTNKDLSYKQKLNQAKKAMNDPQRRKSIDLPIKKVTKKNNKEITENTRKVENRENRENRETRQNSVKKRRPEINTQKTPNKIKNINYNNKSKDIAPLKTGKSGDRGEFKFGMNRNKKQIMNKTPDAGRMKNRKNSGGNENNEIKKQKYGNVDIKSIIKNSTLKSNENENDKNNNEEKINENSNNNKNIKEEKIIHYRKIRNKKYDSNYLECLHLALNSGFFNPKKKLNIIINSKELYINFDRKKVIKELIDYYDKIGNQNIINSAKKDKNKYDIKKINESFKPNERSINAMNFIDKNEEQKLINEVQHPYVSELFKAVIILLNEYKDTDENKNIFEFFFNDILLKYNAKNIKKLMVNKFVDDRLIINDEQFELIQKMLLVKPDLFSPATLLRYNRAVAYFSFFVKELFSYLNQKTEDGKYYYKIRANLPKNKYQEKINNLKLFL